MVDWSKVSVEVLGDYTSRAISRLESEGKESTVPAIMELRSKLYQRDIDIANVVDGMKIKIK
ncbi:MAG: hypothetical protein RL179_2199 [Planctomycetota bacterium]